MSALDNVRYLLEALRTPATPAHTTLADGTVVQPRSNKLGPIEQRRDGYRLYVQEAKTNGEEPQSYEEWISKEN